MNDKNPDCPCKRDCARHADCAACRENHAENGKPTACERMKKDKFSRFGRMWAAKVESLFRCPLRKSKKSRECPSTIRF